MTVEVQINHTPKHTASTLSTRCISSFHWNFSQRKWTIHFKYTVGMESRKQWLLYRASIVSAKNKRRTNELSKLFNYCKATAGLFFLLTICETFNISLHLASASFFSLHARIYMYCFRLFHFLSFFPFSPFLLLSECQV